MQLLCDLEAGSSPHCSHLSPAAACTWGGCPLQTAGLTLQCAGSVTPPHVAPDSNLLLLQGSSKIMS